jgi:hypothetical protein
MLGSKGQEEGPFALLLAAVMLAMLIPIVASLFSQFQQWECESRIENNVETLAREFELAATLGGGVRQVVVDLGASGCGNLVVDRFRIEEPDQGTCIDQCQTPHCRVIKAVQVLPANYEDPTLAGQEMVVVPPVCVRVPSNVEFSTTVDPTSDLAQRFLTPGVHTLEFKKTGLSVEIREVLPEGSGGQ